MTTLRIPLYLGIVAFAAAAWAGPADEPRVSPPPATASGVYSVTFHVTAGTPVPTGATLRCRAKVVPSLPGAPPTNTQPAVGVGSPAGCALEIPYSWTTDQARGVAALNYEIQAVSSSGAVVRTTALRHVDVAYPPAGGTANLDVRVSF